jgi:hypothetical protein
MTRRHFLSMLRASVVTGLSSERSRGYDSKQLRLRINPLDHGAVIPVAFLGLGFEISSVALSGFLAPVNKRYIQFVRTIAREGVIRVGGNTSDFASWSPHGAAVALPKGTVIDEASLADLGGFLRATGWKLIWGLNAGTGTPESAAEEAAVVARVAGDRLLAFEAGNEPDLFVQAGHRSAGFGYRQFHDDFTRFVMVLRQRLPGVPLAGPDVADSPDWVASFAAEENRNVKLLTEHYYLNVQTDPSATIGNLLRLDPRFVRIVTQLEAVSRSSGIPYRLVELNSFAGGGKPGVSDTFASALWALDLMFRLASARGSGINWQTGLNHLGFVSSYSPIFQNGTNQFSARPLYYALLAFRKALGGRLAGVQFDAEGINLSAHGFRDARAQLWVALINKDLSASAEVQVQSSEPLRSGEVWRLVAPAPDVTTGVKFAGAEVSADGTWSPAGREGLRATNVTLRVELRPCSAALVALS